MEPVALARSTHHDHVAVTRHQHDVGRVRTGGNALVGVASRSAGAEDERPAYAEDDDGDACVVEPAQLAVAVESLEIVAVSVEEHGDAAERHPVLSGEMELRMAEERQRVGRYRRGEPSLGHVPVVAQHLGLLPRCRRVQLGEPLVGVADEAFDDVDP